jgi:hypothetical protein
MPIERLSLIQQGMLNVIVIGSSCSIRLDPTPTWNEGSDG